MRLPDEWVKRIFQRLDGIYGQQFRAKYSRIESGRDVGIETAKEVWAEELGNFADWPDAIGYALKHLPSDHCPNAMQFRDICRRAPKEQPKALTHKLTEEDHEKARKAAQSAKASLTNKLRDGIDYHWATHPRGHLHLKFIFDAVKRDARFQPAIAYMVENKICTQEGGALAFYKDVRWVSA